MKEPVTIVIPDFYRPLTPSERESLLSIQAHLGDFPITFLKAESESVWYELRELCPDADAVSYDDRYFTSGHSFAKLLLGSQLYADFGWSRYLLVLELTTLINQNELAHWCRQGYDFVQPTSQSEKAEGWLDAAQRRFNPAAGLKKYLGEGSDYEAYGGISLRKVDTFKKITRRKQRAILRFLEENPEIGNDALFWEFYVNRWQADLLIPNRIGRNFFALAYANSSSEVRSTQRPFAYTGLHGALDFPPRYTL